MTMQRREGLASRFLDPSARLPPTGPIGSKRIDTHHEDIMNEEHPVEPPETIAVRVGRLITSYLSPPYYSLGSMASGSATENTALDKWRAKMGEDAAQLWGEVIGHDPEAVRIVELVQYRLGFVPGSARTIRSNDEIRTKYRQSMCEFFG